MFNKNVLTLFFVSLLAVADTAGAATYTINVNTQSLNGVTGSLDFQFNPGVGIFQSATVTIANVSGGTYGGSQSVFGSGVTGGPLPTAINITNTAGQDNEVLDSYIFSKTLTFTLNFTGPAITSPNGADTAGSAFAFSIFSDPAGTVPALTTDPNGVALAINLSNQGRLSTSILSPAVTFAPEPSTLSLLLLPAAIAGARRRSKKR